MKNTLLICSFLSLVAACSSHQMMDSSPFLSKKPDMVKLSRFVASEDSVQKTGPSVSSKEELQDFFDKNTCTLKGVDEEGQEVFQRNLSQEIKEGQEKKRPFWATKTYIKTAKNAYDENFDHVFVSFPLPKLDKKGRGEELFFAFGFNKGTNGLHNLYVGTNTSVFGGQAAGWQDQTSLVGVDFPFQGTRLNYIFHCTANSN